MTAVTTRPAPAPDTAAPPYGAATVVAVTDLGPAFRRVTLAADCLDGARTTGPDEYLGLYLPQPGGPLVLPPPSLDPRAAVAALDPRTRPDLRWYTVRRHLGGGAIDVDIVSAPHGGPGCEWLARVRPGDEAGVLVLPALWQAPDAGRHLLVGDESSLPALVAVLERRRARMAAGRPVAQVRAVVELASRKNLHPEARGVGVEVLERGATRPGEVVTAWTAAHAGCVDHAWVCGEGGLVARVRGALLRAGTPRDSVLACGYWCLGRPRP